MTPVPIMNMRPILESLSVMACIGAVAVMVFWLLTACTPEETRSAAFVAEMNGCLAKFPPQRCEERVACKHAVERRYGLTPRGYCEDAGAP